MALTTVIVQILFDPVSKTQEMNKEASEALLLQHK